MKRFIDIEYWHISIHICMHGAVAWSWRNPSDPSSPIFRKEMFEPGLQFTSDSRRPHEQLPPYDDEEPQGPIG